MATLGAIRAWLLDSGANANHISAEVGTRVYPVLLPETPSYPAVVVSQVSRSDQEAHNGNRFYAFIRVQVDAYAETLEEATDIGDKIRASLSARTAFVMGSDPDATLAVQESHGGTEVTQWEDALEVWRVLQDFTIGYA